MTRLRRLELEVRHCVQATALFGLVAVVALLAAILR